MIKMKYLIFLNILASVLALLQLTESMFPSTMLTNQASKLIKYQNDPDYDRTPSELIQNKGLPFEKYTVITSDYYELEVNRIPNKNNSKAEVVFCQHGLQTSSKDFLANFRHNSLGFMLHDKGYDVWLGNFRGNKYSRKNSKISEYDRKFWDFSWDENAKYDLPAMIDYVLNKTSKTKLHYVCHSMGCTSMLSLLSDRPDYQKKIIDIAAMAPSASSVHATSPTLFLAQFPILLKAVALAVTQTDFKLFLDSPKPIRKLCTNPITMSLCTAYVEQYAGTNKYLNKTRAAVYSTMIPLGMSVRTVLQYGQHKRSKDLQGTPFFQKYDFGTAQNQVKYGQPTPPQYNISVIKIPFAIYSALGDQFVNQKDLVFLRKNLNIKVDLFYEDTGFTHSDFTLSPNASQIIYPSILDFIGNSSTRT